MSKYLYMMVSSDEYELPLAVADSPSELGRMVGTNPRNIIAAIYHSKVRGNKSKYRKVEVEE